MIQSVIPTPATQPGAPGDALAQLGADTTEGTDFSALLAQTAGAAKLAEGPLDGPVAAQRDAAELMQLPLMAATTGNDLPVGLPVGAAAFGVTPPAFPAAIRSLPVAAPTERPNAPGPALSDPSSSLAPPRPEVGVRPAIIAQLPGTASGKPAPPALPAKTASDRSAATTQAANAKPTVPLRQPGEAPAPDDRLADLTMPGPSDAAVLAAPPLAPVSATLVAPTAPWGPAALSLAQPVRPEPAPAVASAAQPLPQPAAEAVVHAAPQAAFLRDLAPPAIAPQPSLAAAAAQPQAQPQAHESTPVRLEVAWPIQAARRAKSAEPGADFARRPVLLDLPMSEPAAALPPASASAVQLGAALAAPAPVASLRPHDFTALVDRLVAAREAAQPQRALLTVAHAEFGPVELRFRHEERGLAVSLASADPDFARVAAAAAPPNLPFSTAQFGSADSSQPGARGDAGSALGGSATNQSRGQQSERRGEAAPQSNHPPHSAATGTAARRSGIFA